jgi:zinc transport system substrate-binding protein
MRILGILLAVLVGTAPIAAWAQEGISVLASIKPVHSIASAVMAGMGTPELLLTGGASPHSYSLKPSDARKLARANVVFWIGPEMENFLVGPLETLSGKARIIALAHAPGMRLLPPRQGGLWEADPDEPGGMIDGHVWLDPMNASAMGRAMATALGAADPAHAANYRRNADMFAARMTALDTSLATQLAAVRGRPYIVFHDAYHYFDARYPWAPGASRTSTTGFGGPRRSAFSRRRNSRRNSSPR